MFKRLRYLIPKQILACLPVLQRKINRKKLASKGTAIKMEQVLDGELPRTYVIKRHQSYGYGFVAGSESPTVVKVVEPNGPSHKRLLPGDIIMAVNGIDVGQASREQVIKMIQLCDDQIEIKVRQPTYEELIRAKNLTDPKFYTLNKYNHYDRMTNLSSATLNRSSMKKKSNGADNQPLLRRSNTMQPIKSTKSIKPPAKVMKILEVVIKIFFEVGHTRVLTYDQNTTVGTILETLDARLTSNSRYSERIRRYFGLAVTVGERVSLSLKGIDEPLPRRKLLHILDENDSITRIRQLPYSGDLRLLYRMIHPPSDINTLYAQAKAAFEYLYQQSCNDLKLERFDPELDQETALKLSALHLLEYVYSNHSRAHGNSKDPKVYIKLVKKAPGIEHFLPASMTETIIDKKGKRIVAQYKKLRARLSEQLKKHLEEFDFNSPDESITRDDFTEVPLPTMKNSPSEYVKLLFLNYLKQLPCYGNYKPPVRAKSTSPIEKASSQTVDQPDMAQTPSIESISSITFNMQSSPSPQHAPSYHSQQSGRCTGTTLGMEPIPAPRQIEDWLRNVILLPPPPPSNVLRYTFTQVLTDRDIEQLKVPPPPKMINGYIGGG